MALTLPARTQKPRVSGLTCLTDTGLTLAAAQAMMDDYSDFVDVVKLGVGTAYVTPRLSEKIKLYQDHGCIVYFGGTLCEKFVSQGRFDEYLSYCAAQNVDTVEISSGSLDLHVEDVLRLIKQAKTDFRVFTEVGSKDVDTIMAPSKWIYELQAALDAGSSYVITEGRDSGTAGIFRGSGEMRSGLIEDIGAQIDLEKLIFEAPTQASQMFFINRFGNAVNLGNIKPEDVLILEAQRKGLRYETFNLS